MTSTTQLSEDAAEARAGRDPQCNDLGGGEVWTRALPLRRRRKQCPKRGVEEPSGNAPSLGRAGGRLESLDARRGGTRQRQEAGGILRGLHGTAGRAESHGRGRTLLGEPSREQERAQRVRRDAATGAAQGVPRRLVEREGGVRCSEDPPAVEEADRSGGTRLRSHERELTPKSARGDGREPLHALANEAGRHGVGPEAQARRKPRAPPETSRVVPERGGVEYAELPSGEVSEAFEGVNDASTGLGREGEGHRIHGEVTPREVGLDGCPKPHCRQGPRSDIMFSTQRCEVEVPRDPSMGAGDAGSAEARLLVGATVEGSGDAPCELGGPVGGEVQVADRQPDGEVTDGAADGPQRGVIRLSGGDGGVEDAAERGIEGPTKRVPARAC